MKAFISDDTEDVTGVAHPQDVSRSRYERFQRFLTADVNAAIEGAELIAGSRRPLSMMQGFEGSDVAASVGYHARAGAESILTSSPPPAPPRESCSSRD